MEWISVNNRLPEIYKEVLGFVHGMIHQGYFMPASHISEYISKQKPEKILFFDGMGYSDLGYVTHWMPLPDPPTVGNS